MTITAARLIDTGFLQKPPEIFSAIMPPGRQLHAGKVYLQRMNRAQASELLQLFSNNSAWLNRWLQPLPAKLSLVQMQDLIAEDHKCARQGTRLDLGIFSSADHSLIGRIALHSVDYGIQRSAGLSYWISREFGGGGLMTMSLATIVAFAFEEACLHRLWLNVICDNLASLRVAEKLGFCREGMLRKNLFINGSWQDSVLLSLLEVDYDNLADEWIEKGWLGLAGD